MTKKRWIAEKGNSLDSEGFTVRDQTGDVVAIGDNMYDGIRIAKLPQLQDALQTAIRWLRRLEQEYPGCLNDDAIDKHLQPALNGNDK